MASQHALCLCRWELFTEQDEAYIEDVLGGDLPKVAVEAGVRLGWDQWIGRKGKFVGMSSFGASCPIRISSRISALRQRMWHQRLSSRLIFRHSDKVNAFEPLLRPIGAFLWGWLCIFRGL